MKEVTKFDYHINNGKEIISADDINKVQQSINNTEKDIIDLYSQTFKAKALFALEHNKNVNSMFMDTLETPYKIYKSVSENIEYDENEKCIRLLKHGAVKEGIFQSTKMVSQYSPMINKVLLLVDTDVPKGCKINYFVSSDGVSFFPIKPGGTQPTTLGIMGNALYVKAVLYKNAKLQSPRIFSWALLYHDSLIENVAQIGDVELDNVNISTAGETTLIRDKTKGDKLVAVISNNSITELKYGEDGRLVDVVTKSGSGTNTTTLNYGDYLNSKDETENVLLSVTTKAEQL